MSNSLCLKERSYFFLFGKFKEMNLSIFFLFNSSFPLDFQTHYMNFSEFLLKKCVKTHVFLNSSGLNEPLVIFCLDRICKNNKAWVGRFCNHFAILHNYKDGTGSSIELSFLPHGTLEPTLSPDRAECHFHNFGRWSCFFCQFFKIFNIFFKDFLTFFHLAPYPIY